MERKKASTVQIIIIILLSILLVISLILGASFAWFADQNTGTSTMTMGGKIIIKLENSEAKTATFVDETGLMPGAKVESDVNVFIGQSTTPVFLRTKIDIDIAPKDDSFTLSENTKNMAINTFNSGIQSMINDTGTLFLSSSDLTGQDENGSGHSFGNVVTKGAKWIYYEGWYYLVSVDQSMDATMPEDIQLLNIYTGNASLLLSFVKGNFYLPGVEWGNELKDCDLTFDITAQAIQIFQTQKDGEERAIYHNETLDEALIVFGEALETCIVFYQNGGTGTLPAAIYEGEVYEIGDMITLPDATLLKEGKTFKCWNTREDGEGINYYAGDQIKLTLGRRKLYAMYNE